MSGPRLSVIPAGALDDMTRGDMKPMDLRVLCALGTFTNDAGWARVRQDTLADRAGTTRETANRCIGRLVKLGWVEKHAGRTAASASSYRVKLDVDRPPVATESDADEDAHCDRAVTTRCDDSGHIRCDDSDHNMNESLNESPLSPQSGDKAKTEGDPETGTPAPVGSGRAAGSGQSKSRRRRRRGQTDEAAAPVAPVVTLADIQPDLEQLGLAERAVLTAALNGRQPPASVRAMAGGFQVIEVTDEEISDGHRWRLAAADHVNHDRMRSVLTGAMLFLGIHKSIWRRSLAEKQVAKGRARWVEEDPWGVELKPEIKEPTCDAA
ncbi:helix-turn-helix domain-containing protein [Hyphobacterium sp.]|uniref:helix-turn-helix domain-containing protein n=1 Tax=Hyphobacterium sp. TaxID=2004662 RepID=UPI003B5155A1